jgi:hypothetical protein
MKKIILISAVLFFTILNGSKAQFANVNPIPSYNYQMTTQTAGFQEMNPNRSTTEKRDMDIEVTTSSDAMQTIFATVLIVQKNGTQVLGPYTVLVNTTLSVQLPNNAQWGAVVNCSWNVTLNVWIQ